MAEENDEPIDDAAAADEWAAMLDDEDGGGDDGLGDMSADDLAAWEAEAGGDDGDVEAGDGDGEGEEGGDAFDDMDSEEPERVLNQNEIDLLLGFDNDDDGQAERGIDAILGKAAMAYEKLPMLEVVFDRMVRVLSSSLRNFTSDNVDINIESMESLRFDDYLNSIPLPALLVVFRAVEWENFGLVTVDSSLIYSIVDVLLGGRRTTSNIRVEGRPYTTIEQDIVKKLVDVILSDMGTAFEPLSPVNFLHERLENNPRFATITRPNNAALLVKLRVDMEERGGVIEILFPHNTLEPIRDLLMQIFMGETFGQDAVWEKHLGSEIRQSDVDVEAVLNEKSISMGEVFNFKVGSTLLLDCTPNTDISLKCGDVVVGAGKLGRLGEKLAISLLDPIENLEGEEA